jgi:hypothetical protein
MPKACFKRELTSAGSATPSATTNRDSRLIAAQILISAEVLYHGRDGVTDWQSDRLTPYDCLSARLPSVDELLTRDMVPVHASYSPSTTMVQSSHPFQHEA